jgi:acyl-CoA thioester hydrolase
MTGTAATAAHTFDLRVYWEDTDAAGIVYYANYLKFAERARTEMLRRLGVEQDALRRETGTVFAVKRCAVDYIAPARLDDALTVATELTQLGHASLALAQTVARGKDPLARLQLRIACLGPDMKPTRLPPSLRTALARHLAPSSGDTDDNGH